MRWGPSKKPLSDGSGYELAVFCNFDGALSHTHTQPHRYPPVGRCVYCGCADDLSDEHIIPAGLGGRIVLPKASCKTCAAETSRFERWCLQDMFDTLRSKVGIVSQDKRRRARQPTHVTLRRGVRSIGDRLVRGSGVEETWEIAAVAAMLALPILRPPLLTSGLGPPYQHKIGVYLGTIGTLSSPTHGEGLTQAFRSFETALYRLLAKIAHSFAVAEYGLDSFGPYGTALIMDGDESYLPSILGSDLSLLLESDRQPDHDDLHEIDSCIRRAHAGERVVVVRIRLFAELGTPVYYVVAGELM